MPMENKDFIKENYEAIIENMVDGLFTVDPDLTITSWNKAAAAKYAESVRVK